jgi:hypothetical protein
MPARRLVPAPAEKPTAEQRGAWRLPQRRPPQRSVARWLAAQAEWNQARGPKGLTLELSGQINREAIDGSA